MNQLGHSNALRSGAGLLGALTVGAVLAVQSRVNGELGTRLDDGIAAAMVSFGGGLLVLLAWTALTPSGRRGFGRLKAGLRSGELTPVQCLGGVFGGYLVCTQGFAAGILGVALFTVGVVSGQVISGLLVDRWGVGPAGPQPLTPARLVGGALALVAVVIAVSPRLGGTSASWLIVLPLVAGLGTAWQQAVNGRVKQTSDSAGTAATLNFAAGTAAILLAFGVEITIRGLPEPAPAQIWLYTGGILGIVVVGGAAVLVRYTGVLVLSMGMVGGQLLGALLLDVLIPAPGTGVEPETVVGIALTLVAVLIAAWPSRAAARPRDLPR